MDKPKRETIIYLFIFVSNKYLPDSGLNAGEAEKSMVCIFPLKRSQYSEGH